MTTGTSDYHVLGTGRYDLAEGPQWVANRATLRFVDMVAGTSVELDPRNGAVTERFVGAPLGFALPTADGGLICGIGRNIVAVDGDIVRVLAAVPADCGPGGRLNDGAADRCGRLWSGVVAGPSAPRSGALLRVGADLDVHVAASGFQLPNGIGWSPDGRVMYVADSLAGTIDVFTFDGAAGTIHGRRRFISIDSADGMPDGLAVDLDGHIWVALWGGSRVRRYAPDGASATDHRVPVSLVTSCTFGGEHLSDLFVTTARSGLSVQERAGQPLAGAVFALATDTHGQLPTALTIRASGRVS